VNGEYVVCLPPLAPREIYPHSLALLFLYHKPTPIHTNSANRQPKANPAGLSAICLRYKGDLVKDTSIGHKIDISTRRRSTLTRMKIPFGHQSLVERGRRLTAQATSFFTIPLSSYKDRDCHSSE